ncbi:hypothetical protein BC826DRAFT_1021296 [Russula brevipes]|nr:hypothetical protein BC826DRAFT_1021296 [Russula brevipes]
MRSFLAAAGLVLYALFSISLSAAAPANAPAQSSSRCGEDYCKGTWSNDTKYFCGDIRLGPVVLPKKMPLSTIVAEYDRLGGLCPGEFIKKWWNASSGGWIYPSDNGFQLDIYGKPIEGQEKLPVGLLLDRFGSEFGTFLAPADSPYSQRSLPPQNLDTPETSPTYPYNYHIYKVIQPFVVSSGTIAPWFGQPGQGTQYQASSNVLTLISNGSLERVDLHEKRNAEQFERQIEEQRRRRRSLELDVS